MTPQQRAVLTDEEQALESRDLSAKDLPGSLFPQYDIEISKLLTSLADARVEIEKLSTDRYALQFSLERANMELTYLRKATPDVRTTT